MRRSITVRDVEDFLRQGIREVSVDLDTIVTDMAQEKGNALGIRFIHTTSSRQREDPPRLETDLRSNFRKSLQSNVSVLGQRPSGCLHNEEGIRAREEDVLSSPPEKVAASQGSIVDRIVQAIRGAK